MAEMLEKMKENILPVFLEELLMFKFFFFEKNKKNPNFPERSEFKLCRVSVSEMKAMCFKRLSKEGCLGLICGGSSAYDISFYNMKVRNVLFAMGVMAF